MNPGKRAFRIVIALGHPLLNALSALWPVALMLTPMALWGMSALFRFVGGVRRRDDGWASSVLGLRLFLAGWAGGMVLWLGSCWLLDARERAWAARDTLLVPKMSEISYLPLEYRIVELHRQNLEKVLESPEQ